MVVTTRVVIAREDGTVVATVLDGPDLAALLLCACPVSAAWELERAAARARNAGLDDRAMTLSHAAQRMRMERQASQVRARRAAVTDGRLPSASRMHRPLPEPPCRIKPE